MVGGGALAALARFVGGIIDNEGITDWTGFPRKASPANSSRGLRALQ